MSNIISQFDVDDRVQINSDFLGVQWCKGRLGTIVRCRPSRAIQGHVYGVSVDGTPWVLDFNDDELLAVCPACERADCDGHCD